MLHTDGLVERPGELIDDALQRLVRVSAGVAGLEALRAHVGAGLVGSAHPRDDVALCLRSTPSTTPGATDDRWMPRRRRLGGSRLRWGTP